MRKRIMFISALLISLFVSTNALGQAFDPWVYENPEKEIYAIETCWSETPLKVGNDFPKAMIRNFAKAFCSQYQKYAPNVAMTLYLKNPGNNNVEMDNYYMEDDPRNGFIRCNMPGQFDYLTEMCYWKRAMKVYQTVKDILAKHTGTPTFNLPNEGKDIRVHYIEFIQTGENDFK